MIAWQEPMLATLTTEHFSDENWLYERKLDGVRALCYRQNGKVSLWSRNRKPMSASYPEIIETLADRDGPDYVIDGEIVAFDGTQTSFARLAHRIHVDDPEQARHTGVNVFYYVFDLLHYAGSDATSIGQRQRKHLLRDAFDFTDPLRYCQHRNTDGERFYEQACVSGWEGLIAKRADAPYRAGRSGHWLKFKCVSNQEFVVGGFTDPQGARIGFGALLLGYYDGDKFRYAGKVGTGYDEVMLREIRVRLGKLTRKRSPFNENIAESKAHWVHPTLVVHVAFSEWTQDGRLRHPRFLGIREDKSPDNVIRELR